MPITDNFNRADGGLGSGWEHVAGGTAMVINSNAAQAGASFQRETMRRSEADFPDDHYSQAECSFTTGAESAQTGVTVRTDGSGNCYYLSLDTGGCQLRKIVAGSDTFVADYVSAHTASVFYTMKLECTGTTLKIFEDTVEKLSTTDSSLTTGKPGIFADGNLDKPDLDDFESTDEVEDEFMIGTDVLDFGAFPGKTDTSVVVAGQTTIAAGSLVEAWIRPVTTAEHSADEHMVESIKVVAGNIVAGTGFTIYGFVSEQMTELRPQIWTGREAELPGTRLYGTWNVNWAWA